MALNFRIVFSRQKDSLIVQLNGDFDGSSALELLNALNHCDQPDLPIKINTDNIKKIYPFGRVTFKNNFKNFVKDSRNIEFTGAKSIFINRMKAA